MFKNNLKCYFELFDKKRFKICLVLVDYLWCEEV